MVADSNLEGVGVPDATPDSTFREVAWAQDFEEYVRAVMEEYRIPGLAAAFFKDGEVIYANGFGVRDRHAGLAVTPTTVFGIGSATKSLTAMAIMQLQEAGKLSVDDEAIKYLPTSAIEDEDKLAGLTLRHFMSHLAGLPPQPTLGFALKPSMEDHPPFDPEAEAPDGQADAPPMETYQQLTDYLRTADYTLLGEPGEFFSYSNEAYALLGAVIEEVSGTDYAEFIEERILKPAGMSRSTFELEDLAEWDNVTELYFENKNEELVDVPQWPDSIAFRAAGFLRSTVLDMLRYAEVYVNEGVVGENRILSADSIEAMSEPQFQLYDYLHYGFGLMVQPDYEGVTLVEHGGSISGVAAQFGFVPEKGIAGVVLTNLAGVPSVNVWLAGINAMLGLPLSHKRTDYDEIELSDDEKRRFTGTYVSGEGARIDITLENGKLYAESMGQRIRLRPIGDHRLLTVHRGTELPVRFYPDDSGEYYASFFGFRVLQRVPEQNEQV